MPLAYIYDAHVLVLNSPRPDKAVFAAFLEWARTRYERVLFLGGGGTDLLSPSWSARPVASERFRCPSTMPPVDAYPRFARSKEFDYSLYALHAARSGAMQRGRSISTSASATTCTSLRFHAKESSEGRSFRWSRDRSLITVTGLTAASRDVVLSMNDGGRPPAVPPADVTISLAGEAARHRPRDDRFQGLRRRYPAVARRNASAAGGGTAEMRLTTSVWKPETVLGSGRRPRARRHGRPRHGKIIPGSAGD